jgi:hypothetical protein
MIRILQNIPSFATLLRGRSTRFVIMKALILTLGTRGDIEPQATERSAPSGLG